MILLLLDVHTLVHNLNQGVMPTPRDSRSPRKSCRWSLATHSVSCTSSGLGARVTGSCARSIRM